MISLAEKTPHYDVTLVVAFGDAQSKLPAWLTRPAH
jgi:hypothetical protein